MTTLASWITNDSHGIASLYIASESRVTRPAGDGVVPRVISDSYQKTFASTETPDIFGIFGIVTHAPEIINALLPKLQSLRDSNLTSDYSLAVSNAISRIRLQHFDHTSFEIIHGYRMGRRDFGCSRISVKVANGSVSTTTIPMPLQHNHSFHCTWASGGPYIYDVQRDDLETDARGLSRWHWQTFYDAISRTADPYSGGAPQLVGLYTKGNGIPLGVFYSGSRYIFGSRVDSLMLIKTVEWRDDLFQRVDGETGKLLPGAQRHARNEKIAILSKYG